jgi:hypothetical protein
VPTYWAYSPVLKRRIDRTPAVYGIEGEEKRFIYRAPFMQELSIKVGGVNDNTAWPFNLKKQYDKCGDSAFTSIKPSRMALVEKNVESVVEQVSGLTPLFFCLTAMVSVLFINLVDQQFAQNRPLSDIIAKLIINKL